MKKLLDWCCAHGIHFWHEGNPRKHENPYRRTCRHCGRSQCFYVPSWDYWAFDSKGNFAYNEKGEALCRPNNNKNGWWE